MRGGNLPVAGRHEKDDVVGVGVRGKREVDNLAALRNDALLHARRCHDALRPVVIGMLLGTCGFATGASEYWTRLNNLSRTQWDSFSGSPAPLELKIYSLNEYEVES